MRAATSCGKVCTGSQNNEPIPKILTARSNTRRVPRRSHNHRLAGISTVRVRT